MAMYTEESWSPARAALIMSIDGVDWKLVHSGAAMGAGHTTQEFPYSVNGNNWESGYTKGANCPQEFCLFDIYNDEEEKTDKAQSNPLVYQTLLDRFRVHQKTVYQSKFFDKTQSNCKTLSQTLDANGGFVGPHCTH